MNEAEYQSKQAETLKAQFTEAQAGKIAAATPLPGAARDAFAIDLFIQVGPFKVRQFTDGDIELIAQLKHPLEKLITKVMADVEVKRDDPLFDAIPKRGPVAWQLFWIMTSSRAEVRQAMRGGIVELNALAEDRFSAYQFEAMVELLGAVLQQVTQYFSTVVGYEEKKTEGEKSLNPPLPESMPTALDGCSPSVAA